jgi:AraC-like DNA-binding protein
MNYNYPKVYLYKRIVQAKLFIDAYYSEKIDLNNIADEAYFSKFHFIRLFKAIYGMTPHQYLTRVRVENARILLQKGMSVTQTCFAVGFTSVSSFTGLFNRYLKRSPSEYQRQFLAKQALIQHAPLQFIPGCFAEKKGWTHKSNFQEVVKKNTVDLCTKL